MNHYKKHPGVLEMIQYPEIIIRKYYHVCEYRYFSIGDFGEIPFPLFALLGLEHNGKTIDDIPKVDYAQGFIEGYNTDMVPFIDTLDARKEIILTESIFKGDTGFKEHHTVDGLVYESAAMFEMGLFQGKRYKAWEIIFETPSAFIQYFEPSPQLKGFDFLKRKTFPKDVLEKVFNLLVREKIISGKESDFIAMFSKAGIVEVPIQWLMIAKRTNRGNKQALCTFLEIMFDGLPSDVMRTAGRLFVDYQGEFLNPKYKIKDRRLKIEKALKEILKNTRPIEHPTNS